MNIPNINSPNSRNIEILDVSNMLYIATAMVSPIKHNPNIIKGINISGVSYILNKIANNYRSNVRTVLALDSFTDRKNLSSSYKANRTFHPEIAVQSELIYTYFKDFGVDVLKVPGMEADDLIYSAVYTNYADAQNISVYTGDRDLYGCLIGSKVNIVGTSSNRPSLNVYNYEISCDPKEKIVYNTVLPYTMIFGKPSNNVKVLKTGVKNSVIYSSFIKWLSDTKQDMEFASCQSTFIEFAADCHAGKVSDCVFFDSDLSQILERLPLVYPNIIDLPIAGKAPEINVEKLLEFLSFYRQYTACEKFGLNNFVHTVTVPAQMNTMLRRMSAVINNGQMAADNHLSSNTLPIAIKSTNEFMTIERWD